MKDSVNAADNNASSPERDFSIRVLKVLYGTSVDVGFLGETLSSAEAIDALNKASKLKKKDLQALDKLVIGDPPKIFESPELKDKGGTKGNREKAIAEYRRQIEAERRFAENDRDEGHSERMPEQRLSFLAMADKLMDMKEPQRAFEFLESARAIRMRAGIVDSRDAIVSENVLSREIAAERNAAQEDLDEKRNERVPAQRLSKLSEAEEKVADGDLDEAQKILTAAKALRKGLSNADGAVDSLADLDGTAVDDDYGMLDYRYRDAVARVNDLMRRAKGLKDFAEQLSASEKRSDKYKKSKDIGANALPQLRGPQQELALLSIKLGGVKDVPNTEDNRAELERNEREIETLANHLKDVEAPLRKWLAKKAEDGVNRMKTFIKTEDGQLVRTGGNESGGGQAKGRSKTNGVPQEYLDQLAVAVDVHQRFIEAGELDWEHFQALASIRSEAMKVKRHLDKNLVHYQRCDHFLKMARKKLADEHYSFLTALRESFVHKVDTYEKLIDTDPEEAHALLDALTADLRKTEVNQPFTDAGLEHKALEKLYNEIKSLLTKDYAPLLSKVVAEYETYLNEDSDDRLGRGFKNFLRRRRSYKGIYHSQVEEHWANYDTGSNNARTVLRSRLEPMMQTIQEEIKALKFLDGKSAAGGSWGELSARAAILERAVEDLDKSEAEIRERADLEKEYQKIYDSAQSQIDKYSFRLLAFWKRFGKKDRRMDKRVGDALSNHRILLKALKSRSKTTKTVDQWKDLIADAEKKRGQIERFIEANSIPRADGKPSNDQTAAADALKRCGEAIDKFTADISDFAKKVEGERDKLDAIAGKKGSDAGDARKAVALIDKEIGKVKRFVEVFAKGFDGHGFDVLSKSIDDADADKVMELRENAVAKLRRYRTHLTDSQLGRLYASNPFDEGARAVPLRLEMIRAEGILNTKIKPS